MHKIIILIILITAIPITAHLQMQANFTSTVNTVCNGVDCNYSGPSILINEIMISPTVDDGSLFENGNNRQGEWIELYNPDVCQPVDISCYYLGNNAPDLGMNYGAGIRIPNGTVIPPAGFCVLRGKNAPSVPPGNLIQNGGNVVEITIVGSMICMEGTRLWFPNAGGWFAFYDANGVPQDAVSWGNQSNVGFNPCHATNLSCSGNNNLVNYDQIPSGRKHYIYGAFPDSWGRSIRRMPDGGQWVTSSGAFPPTIGNCNDVCAQVGTSSCDGTATINVTGGAPPYSYSWDDSQAQTTQTAIDLCAGTYNVSVTDNNGATQTFSVTIEDFVPDVYFSFIDEICNEGQNIPFTDYSPIPATGQTGVFSGIGVVGNSFDASISGDGQFSITYTFTDENGCSNYAESIINVHPTPNATISGLGQSYCFSNDIIPITTSPSGGILTGNGVSNNSFDIAQAGVGNHNITYTVTSDFGCSANNQIIVSVFDNPSFTIMKKDTFCGDNSGEIHIQTNGGTAPYQYSIDDGNTFQNNGNFNQLAGGDYSIVVVDANGCSATSSVHLVSMPYPNISAPDNIHTCIGETVVITANNPDLISFSWSPDLEDGVSFVPTYMGSETYTLTATVNGCTTTDHVTVTVHDFPTVGAGKDRVICKGEGVILNGTGAEFYSWSGGISNGVPFYPETTATYTVIGTDFWGCRNIASVTITVNPIPDPNFVGDTLIGCQPHPVIFTNLSNLDGIVSCEWDFGDNSTSTKFNNVSHVYISGGTYDVSLSITDTNGCVGTKSIKDYIEVISKPKALFYPDPVVTGTSTPIINFINKSQNGTQYTWHFGVGADSANTFNASYMFPDDKARDYIVTLIVVNDFGCSDTISQAVRIIEDLIFYIPNTFTPDYDEFNQVFQPIFTQGYNPLDFAMKIYDRWGELIFESRDASIGWDGMYGGKIVPDGTYIWKIEVGLKNSSERKKIQGHINLIR